MRIACTLLLTSLSALALSAQQPPITTLHAIARVVVLDVVVNDGQGRAVKGLKASDFYLSEDGVPQTLASFVEHNSEPVLTPSTPPNLASDTFAVQPPVNGNGVMSVIVLGNVAASDAPYVQTQIRDYLKANPVTMPMAIFRVDIFGLHLIQDFTTDNAVLLRAANSKRMLPLPLLPVAPGENPLRNFRRGTLNLRNYLAKIPGRVNLLWFSSGDAGERSFPDIASFVQDAGKGPMEVLQLSRVALYTFDAGGLKAPDLLMNESLSGASGGSTGTGFSRQDFGGAAVANAAIADKASQWGGRGYYNTNGFKQAIAEVIDTTTHYYTLSYTPTNANWNGEFRKIHVDVPGYSVPLGFTWGKFFGVYDEHKVEYRSGYYARTNPGPYARQARPLSAANSAPGLVLGSTPGVNPNRRPLTPASTRRPVRQPPNPLEVAMAFAAPTPTDLHFTVGITPSDQVVKPAKDAPLPNEVYLTAPFKSAPYRTVRLHYDINPADVSFQKTAKGTYADDLQFVAVLYRDDGLLANSITFTAHIDVDAATYARSQSAPLAYDQSIAIPTTGVFFLRACVEEVPTERIGALQLPSEEIQ